MHSKKYRKNTFSVIGKEGSTADGEGFVQRLWADANAHCGEVAHLAKTDENGKILGIWGAMTDFSRSFAPWQKGFSQGLYLAGVEVSDDAEAPAGWTKWKVPAFEYLCVKVEAEDTFAKTLAYMQENNVPLAGAVQDFTNPEEGVNYMLFPVKRL